MVLHIKRLKRDIKRWEVRHTFKENNQLVDGLARQGIQCNKDLIQVWNESRGCGSFCCFFYPCIDLLNFGGDGSWVFLQAKGWNFLFFLYLLVDGYLEVQCEYMSVWGRVFWATTSQLRFQVFRNKSKSLGATLMAFASKGIKQLGIGMQWPWLPGTD